VDWFERLGGLAGIVLLRLGVSGGYSFLTFLALWQHLTTTDLQGAQNGQLKIGDI
jgi:hypothetical protein